MYAACMRREHGYCGIEFAEASADGFKLNGANDPSATTAANVSPLSTYTI